MLNQIHWLGHNTFVISGEPLIYLNASVGGLESPPPADVIAVTHASYDNCTPRVLEQLWQPETRLLASTAHAECFAGYPVHVLRPWQSASLGRVSLTAVPSHPVKSLGGDGGQHTPVGYLISKAYFDIYFASETVHLPDTVALRADIAILPVHNVRTGLLDLEHTLDVVRKLRPRWVIPGGWTENGRGYLDVKAFQAAVSELAEVVIPQAVPISALKAVQGR
ncbi:MAG: MBL fold metallo-hydrolase [Anaerolineae bacterium]